MTTICYIVIPHSTGNCSQPLLHSVLWICTFLTKDFIFFHLYLQGLHIFDSFVFIWKRVLLWSTNHHIIYYAYQAVLELPTSSKLPPAPCWDYWHEPSCMALKSHPLLLLLLNIIELYIFSFPLPASSLPSFNPPPRS